MQRTTFTAAVIRYSDGHTEVITRPGHQEPHGFARAIEAASGAAVVTVRHERVKPNGGDRHTLAIFSPGG